MSRFNASIVLVVITLCCLQTSGAKRKEIIQKENQYGRKLSQTMVKGKNNLKARKLKRRFNGKAKKQKNEIKMQKAKYNNKRSLKSSNQSQKKRTRKKKKMKKLRMSKKTFGESRGAPIVGDVCQFVDFFGARAMGTGCEDGSKLVITQKSGVRKQFLITGGRTIFGFVDKQGGKFRDCACATERTSSAQCKALSGLSEVSLANSVKNRRRPGMRSILKASSCNWIDLEKVREEGSGCVDGSKFVLSKDRGVRRQYLFVDGRTVLAFVKNGEKFAQCANYTDITADVKCKAMDGVENVELASTCSTSLTSTTPTPTQEGRFSLFSYSCDSCINHLKGKL